MVKTKRGRYDRNKVLNFVVVVLQLRCFKPVVLLWHIVVGVPMWFTETAVTLTHWVHTG